MVQIAYKSSQTACKSEYQPIQKKQHGPGEVARPEAFPANFHKIVPSWGIGWRLNGHSFIWSSFLRKDEPMAFSTILAEISIVWPQDETRVLNEFSSVQSLSHVWLFATPWTAARQASLSITKSQNQLKLMSVELVMPSNHPILCWTLLPSIFRSIRGFSNESVLHIRWPMYWSFCFSISPSIEYSGLISFRMDLLGLRDPWESSPMPQFKSINSLALSFLYSPTLTSIHDCWKNHTFG